MKITTFPTIYYCDDYFTKGQYILELWADEMPSGTDKFNCTMDLIKFKLIDLDGNEIGGAGIVSAVYKNKRITMTIEWELPSEVFLKIDNLRCLEHDWAFNTKYVYYDSKGKGHKIVAYYSSEEKRWYDDECEYLKPNY